MWTHFAIFTLVNVLAVDPVRSHSVPVRTRAPERPEGVVTAEGAQGSALGALVYIYTRLYRNV